MSFFFNQPDPKRRRFPIPNDVWKWELKPQGFAILAYLCYLHVHCNKNALPSADEIASQLHMSKDMAVKQIAELNRRGLLDQHMVPILKSNGKNFFSLPNELFFMNIGHGAITVYAYLLYCEDRRTHQCHPSYRTISAAVKRYEGTVARHIKPYLGEKIISQVTGKDIQKLYDILAHHGNRNTGEGLASGTIRGIHAMFHEAMGAAQQAGLIPRNPTEDIDAPKFSYKGKKVLTDEQLEKFMGTIQRDSVWHDFFYTELTTGLRRGEICGLKWEDFDEAKGALRIRRTIHEEKGGKLTAWDTKTAAGTRTINLAPSTAALLRARKKTALTEWIFPHPLKPEQPTRPSAAYERMKDVLKQAELPDIRFHDLRHTFATHALTSGVDVKTLSGILGHTRAAFTLDTYTHTTGDMQKRAAEIVEEFLIDIFGEELKPWEESGKMAKAPSG